MKYLEMVSENSNISHSIASENLRTFIKSQSVRHLYSDYTLPSTVEIKPLIESATGKLVAEIG